MKNRKISKIILSTIMAATCAVSSLGINALPVMAATGDVAINETNFKDVNFRSYVKRFDLDGDTYLSLEEREEVYSIDISYGWDTRIEDLTGISNFPNLEVLDISHSQAKIVDIKSLSNLKMIYACGCAISSIDLSGNSQLDFVDFSECANLTSIDVTKNPNLEILDLWGTKISSINVSNNPKLKYLHLINTDVSVLDVTRNPMLVQLLVSNTQIKELNISNNPELVKCYLTGKNAFDGYSSTDCFYSLDREELDPCHLGFGIKTKIITDKPVNVSPVPVNPTTPTTPVTPTNPSTPVTPATPAPETGLAGFIERLYNVALGRQSEAAGKNWWINEVKFNNQTGTDVAKGFLTSDEFLGKQMSNSDFIEVLYKTFFNRASDAQGKSYWLNQMNGGYSKTDVINGFCNSTEWANLCLTYGIPSGSSATPTIVIAPNEGTNAFVTRLYTTCLGRAPEAAGFEYWTYRLANMQERGSSAAYGFFTSPEFTAKGYDNATYVTLLYRTILGREPDQAGLNYWLGLMANGMSRVDILNGFAASTEWADICSSYGILK